jgi:hypothetical protein
MVLKTHNFKCEVHEHHMHSLGLPIKANCDAKYKLKIDGEKIAKIYVDHNGMIDKIDNFSGKFKVVVDKAHHLIRTRPPYRENKDGGVSWAHPCRTHVPPVIIVNEPHFH